MAFHRMTDLFSYFSLDLLRDLVLAFLVRGEAVHDEAHGRGDSVVTSDDEEEWVAGDLVLS